MAHPNRERQRRIYEYILEAPGASKAEVARAVGITYSALVSTLPALNRGGYLISEDENGRLWPFEAPSLTLDTIKQMVTCV